MEWSLGRRREKKHGGDGSEVGRSGSAHVVRTLICARRRYLTRVGGWWVEVMVVVMVGVVVVVAVEVLLVVVEAVAAGRERQLVAGQSVSGGRQRGAAVAVRCVLRLQQQCSVQCAVCSAVLRVQVLRREAGTGVMQSRCTPADMQM